MKILKFGAVWCPGCLVMSKTWSTLISEYDLDIENYDIDYDEDVCEKWNVDDTLPVYIFLDKNGNEIERLIGEKSITEIKKIIDENKDK